MERMQQELLLLLRYWGADHPTVSEFRWDDSTWGSSWASMALSIVCYLLLIQMLKLLLLLRSKPVPLGPLPALYNLALLLASIAMLAGCLQSARVEIQESRWLWRRTKADWEWLLCFPIGTRPAGRVFFWSYVFYLSKYYEFLGTLILILKKRNPTAGHVFRHAMMVVACFLQLQFAQSLQILALLSNASLYVVMYLYFFLCSLGWASPGCRSLVRGCQIAQFVAMSLASLGLLTLHFTKEGCNGMGSWLFTTLLSASRLPLIALMDRKRGPSCISSMAISPMNR